MVCSVGDKPIVKYRFNNGVERIYQSQFAPIEIVTQTTPVEANSVYNREGYGLTVSAVNGSINNLPVVAHELIQVPPAPGSVFPSGGTFLRYMRCGEITWRRYDPCTDPFHIASGCWNMDYNMNPGTFSINPNTKCPSANLERCSLIVKYNGLILHQDQGNCPVTYEVVCGNCPEGQEEHKINTYPGYCCFDCAGMKQEITSLKNMVKGLTDG
jgi:hypothetical protein